MNRNLMYTLLSYSFLSLSSLAAPSPKLTAEGAILIEPKTNTILYQKNIHQTFYPASTTKVLSTLLLAEELVPNLEITKTLDSIQTVPADSSHIGLSVGDVYTYDAGLHAILMESDNFVSHDMAVINAGSIQAFADKMNERALSIGAMNSNFENPHGYHDPDHYTTPYDLALITEEAFNHPLITQIAGTPSYSLKVLNKGTTLPLTHTGPFFNPKSEFYNPSIIAAKTGFHTPAGRTLVAKATHNDLDLIAVVMHSDYPGYFSDINALFNYGYSNFELAEQRNNRFVLNNISYSSWAYPYIEQAIYNGIFVPSTKSYMDPTTGREFVHLLKKTIPSLNIFSLATLTSNSPTSPHIINTSLTIDTAQRLLSDTAKTLNFTISDTFVVDALTLYKLPSKQYITLEESIYLASLFLHSYSINKPIFTLTQHLY